MDKILIRQLRIDAVIGVHEWEKQFKQTVLLDLDLSYASQTAAQTDDLSHALDYYAICQRLTTVVGDSQYDLIEALAERVADMLLSEFACQKVKVTLFKPEAIPEAQTVGITIKRKRQGIQ